jgi:hypothetical protein
MIENLQQFTGNPAYSISAYSLLMTSGRVRGQLRKFATVKRESRIREALHHIGEMSVAAHADGEPTTRRRSASHRTLWEPRLPSEVDTVLGSAAFVHLRASVQAMIDDGIYPSRDANQLTFELWMVVHGIAALFIAKPYWPQADVEALTDNVLRVMCCGQIAAGIVGYDTAANDAVDHVLRLTNLGRTPPGGDTRQ